MIKNIQEEEMFVVTGKFLIGIVEKWRTSRFNRQGVYGIHQKPVNS
jgi:hypothetical protein